MAANSDTSHLTWQCDTVNLYPQKVNEASVMDCGLKKKMLGHISDICSEVSVLSLVCHHSVQQYAGKKEYIDINNTISTTNKMFCEG